MKKSVKMLVTTILILTMFIAVGIKDVKAATATATLRSDKATVEPGDNFTVTLKASSEQGLNGIITEISYDSEKLELDSASTGTSFTNLESSKTKLSIIATETNVNTADVYSITFKAKSGATGEAEIKTSEINIDTLESGENAMVTEGAKSIKITIDNSDAGSDTGSDTGSGSSSSSGSSGKDTTAADKEYPKTGAETIILPVIIITVFGTIGIIGYKKYKI